MRIQILYFAVLRERLRRDDDVLDLAGVATVATVLSEVSRLRPEIAGLLPRVRVAVNRQMVPPDHAISDGDECALIPPVAGGSAGRRIAVTAEPLSLNEVVAVVEAAGQGGIATFTGCVRNHGTLASVAQLTYEAYVPMAVEVLTAIADEIEREWPGARVAIHHRIGTLTVGEAAVVIAASAPHRAPAFEACRAGIERLKIRAPIWKKEIGPTGEEWVGTGP